MAPRVNWKKVGKVGLILSTLASFVAVIDFVFKPFVQEKFIKQELKVGADGQAVQIVGNNNNVSLPKEGEKDVPKLRIVSFEMVYYDSSGREISELDADSLIDLGKVAKPQIHIWVQNESTESLMSLSGNGRKSLAFRRRLQLETPMGIA